MTADSPGGPKPPLVPGFENYRCSPDGTVTSRATGRVLKTRPGGRVGLSQGGQQYWVKVEEVVWWTFHGGLGHDETIGFLDGDPKNVRPDNLVALDPTGAVSRRLRRLTAEQRKDLFRRLDQGLSLHAAKELFPVGEVEFMYTVRHRRSDE